MTAWLDTKVVIFVSKVHVRGTYHGFVWVFAALWLALEAWLMLDDTFHVPVLQLLLARLGLTDDQIAGLIAMKLASWPIASMTIFLLVREFAQRWMTGHVRCRVADRLATAWFTYVATLITIDQLSPAVTVAWSPGVLAASCWLLLIKAISLTRHVRQPHQNQRLWFGGDSINYAHRLAQKGGVMFSRLRIVKGTNHHGRIPHAQPHRRVR